jgi:hypothetical protein
VLATASCRRHPVVSRGDGAAVVVVPPADRKPASPPKVVEQEPNDSPEQAQLLSINSEWPVLSVEGSLSALGGAQGKDVDVFKLLIPGSLARVEAATAKIDSGQSDDPRLVARRLALEISAEGAGLALQLLDEGLQVQEGVSADAGEVAGMPNMAVLPGHTYFFRVKSVAKPAKTPDTMLSECKYKLAIQLGDFELADEREPNDGMASANPFALVGTAELAGLYGWAHDQDFYRFATPEAGLALDVDLDAVDGVSAGLQVLDGSGKRLAVGRGRRNEKLALRNVNVPAAGPDAASRFFYVVVRGESGQNRDQRYVLRLNLDTPKADQESEPNDDPDHATGVRDGTITGFLPVGDVDYFRYTGEGEREVDISIACPSRVRGKIEVTRSGDREVVASAEAKKPKQTLMLNKVPTLGQPLLLHLSQLKGDGNANEAYTLKITSVPVSGQQKGSTNSPSPLNRD